MDAGSRAIVLAVLLVIIYAGTASASRPSPTADIPANAFVPVSGAIGGGEPDLSSVRTGTPTGTGVLSAVGSTSRPPSTVPRLLAVQEWARWTLGLREWRCLDRIIRRESRWDPAAVNPANGRYGLGQFLGYRNPDPLAQLRHVLAYIAARYGDACGAWRHERATGWY
jgi:hypothetical protein